MAGCMLAFLWQRSPVIMAEAYTPKFMCSLVEHLLCAMHCAQWLSSWLQEPLSLLGKAEVHTVLKGGSEPENRGTDCRMELLPEDISVILGGVFQLERGGNKALWVCFLWALSDPWRSVHASSSEGHRVTEERSLQDPREVPRARPLSRVWSSLPGSSRHCF